MKFNDNIIEDDEDDLTVIGFSEDNDNKTKKNSEQNDINV
jgi:peroxiredoxin